MPTEPETRKLLDKLCADLGFCLPSSAIQRLCTEPPDDARQFTDAVFTAEGLDPQTADRHLYRKVFEVVAAAFSEAE